MEIKKTLILFSAVILLFGGFSSSVLAESVSELKQQESEAMENAETIDAEINSIVVEINKKYEELAKLEEKMANSETTIEQTEKEIKEIQENIEKRKGMAAERLQELQLSNTSQSSLEILLDSESISDFVTRMYAIKMVQGAGNSKVETLYSDQEKLVELEKTLKETQSELETQQTEVEAEKIALDTQVAGLKEQFDANEELLHNLANQRAAKEEEERQKQAARESEKATQQLVANNTNNSSNTNSSDTGSSSSDNNGGYVEDQTSPPESNGGGGNVVAPPVTGGSTQGQATAYIATGNNTATGTVPTPHRTIAVDPSVIPLGSLVQIDVPSAPQYSGVYVAEDTGGAVKGNIIDIFVGSQNEAINFGRRTIYFTVL